MGKYWTGSKKDSHPLFLVTCAQRVVYFRKYYESIYESIIYEYQYHKVELEDQIISGNPRRGASHIVTRVRHCTTCHVQRRSRTVAVARRTSLGRSSRCPMSQLTRVLAGSRPTSSPGFQPRPRPFTSPCRSWPIAAVGVAAPWVAFGASQRVFARMGRKAAKIAGRKAKGEAIRQKLYGKYGKLIVKAVKAGGGSEDPGERHLAKVLADASRLRVPRELVERNLKRATDGSVSATDYAELTYEAYGAGGVGVVIEALSDNANRAAADEDDSEQVGGKLRPSFGPLQLRSERELLSSAPGENQAPIATLRRVRSSACSRSRWRTGAWTSPRWRERRARGVSARDRRGRTLARMSKSARGFWSSRGRGRPRSRWVPLSRESKRRIARRQRRTKHAWRSSWNSMPSSTRCTPSDRKSMLSSYLRSIRRRLLVCIILCYK